MLDILKGLYKVKIISPSGIFHICCSIYRDGKSLMTLLSYAKRKFPNKIAILEETSSITYAELYLQSIKLALLLQNNYGVKEKRKVALIGKNSSNYVKCIFALSTIGVELTLVNTEMSANQIENLIQKCAFEFIITDSSVELQNLSQEVANMDALVQLLNATSFELSDLKRSNKGKFVLLSGGTSGNHKVSHRKASLFQYLNPLNVLVQQMNLTQYQSVYISIPLFHGFGFAALLLSMFLGCTISMAKKFDEFKSVAIITSQKTEVMITVPSIIQKLLRYKSDIFKDIHCVVCGGAPLNSAIIKNPEYGLKNKLFNLYGTTECGFSTIATPEDLIKHPETIGKPFKGVEIKVVDGFNQIVKSNVSGKIFIRNKWSRINNDDSFEDTGDIGYRNSDGYYFLKGRIDEMIICGGENVYLSDVKKILLEHEFIIDANIIAVDDEIFGKKLKAFVVAIEENNLSEVMLKNWLKSRLARFQFLEEIEIVKEIKYSDTGKIIKKENSTNVES